MRYRVLALVLPSLWLFGCDSKPSTSGSTSSATAAAASPAAAPKGSDRKLKTKLTSKQLEDTWAGMKGNFDFKKHTETVTAKLGAPQTVNGDQSCWYGYKAASGAEPDDCMQLCTSATKGSGTQTTDGAGKCWD